MIFLPAIFCKLDEKYKNRSQKNGSHSYGRQKTLYLLPVGEEKMLDSRKNLL